MDKATGISEPTVIIPIGLDCDGKCRHTYTKCWGGYHCLRCMTYFPGMIRPQHGVINWNVQS